MGLETGLDPQVYMSCLQLRLQVTPRIGRLTSDYLVMSYLHPSMSSVVISTQHDQEKKTVINIQMNALGNIRLYSRPIWFLRECLTRNTGRSAQASGCQESGNKPLSAGGTLRRLAVALRKFSKTFLFLATDRC